ncbi:glycerophosphodiester phosphodiesterase [Ramlibacter rhizophilus]|uniref:Glycerophosphodiester phosphodiesterase n=1 Tax=Ramlibacter rhizophilus TaxID=1781167 RepID=A0A4Z0C279_9BURK|nr:glycerophosphodiester phosphodiesterase [Ramlibacter rhizophilus]TFZ04329.1 glycerophosphodiester phosphodiesterase [Ramlibacter rhizophilus]
MPTRRSALALLGASTLAACAGTAGSVPRRIELQGHRGARGLWPENTLAGFAAALALGVDTLELDVGVTKDGVPVVSHDARLNPDITRGPDGQFLSGRGPAIAELTLAELSAYDVGRLRPGSAYARQFPEQTPVDGARIPRLSEVIALLLRSGAHGVQLAVETKVNPLKPEDTLPVADFTRAAIDTLRAGGVARRTTLQSFDWRTLRQVAREAPGMETAHLTLRRPSLDNVAPGSPWTAGFDLRDHGSVPRLVKAAGGRTWSSFHGDLDAAAIAEAQALGLKVLAWTVNEPARMAQLMDMGVDGIITDRPDLLRTLMAQRSMPLPPPRPVRPA